MARRLFLHVGTPKSGTTYLQSVLWANKDALRSQNLLLPLDQFQGHFHLSVIARDSSYQLSMLGTRALTAWDRMTEEVSQWDGDVLISHELFVYCAPGRVKWTTQRLREICDELHIVVTARDLGRQVPAEWQESVKHGGIYRLHEYIELARERRPEFVFWSAQDLVALLAAWGEGLPPEQVHLVTLPPKGGPRHLLLDRFTDVLGVDPRGFDTSVSRSNESLGVAEIETLRRCNLHAPKAPPGTSKNYLTRAILAEGILAQRSGAQKFAPSRDDYAWTVEAGTEMVAALRGLPYDVRGDLDDLIPGTDPGGTVNPDDVSDADVAAVAVETIPALLFGLGDALREARQAFADERDIPLKTHIRRKLGLVKRRLLRQPLA